MRDLLRGAAYAFGRWNRRRKAAFALRVVRHLRIETVLLIGVTGVRGPVSNLAEHRLAKEFEFVVASGIAREVEGWNPFVVADGRRLPFPDNAFDLVYANAVIEHVGDAADQLRFVAEVDRVGRTWIVTTPNRWFPVEAHYHTLLSHWRTEWAPRGTVTRLLGVRDFRALLPAGRVRGWPIVSPTLTAVSVGHVDPKGPRSAKNSW